MFSLLVLVTVLFGVAAIALLVAPPPPARPSLVAQVQGRGPSGGTSCPPYLEQPALRGHPHAG